MCQRVEHADLHPAVLSSFAGGLCSRRQLDALLSTPGCSALAGLAFHGDLHMPLALDCWLRLLSSLGFQLGFVVGDLPTPAWHLSDDRAAVRSSVQHRVRVMVQLCLTRAHSARPAYLSSGLGSGHVCCSLAGRCRPDILLILRAHARQCAHDMLPFRHHAWHPVHDTA